MNLNMQYIVLFKNPHDQQVAHLARQMCPNNWQLLLDVYQNGTKEPNGYLLIDLKQDTADDPRLKTKVIKRGGNCKMLQFTTSSENDEPPVKRLCVENADEPNESGWHNIVQQVYGQYDCQYVKKVESYENDCYSNLEAREKATEDLFWKYRKGIMKQYSDILTTVHNL